MIETPFRAGGIGGGAPLYAVLPLGERVRSSSWTLAWAKNAADDDGHASAAPGNGGASGPNAGRR